MAAWKPSGYSFEGSTVGSTLDEKSADETRICMSGNTESLDLHADKVFKERTFNAVRCQPTLLRPPAPQIGRSGSVMSPGSSMVQALALSDIIR